jgi:glycosyltransferase involved in cell wall biosynthesis
MIYLSVVIPVCNEERFIPQTLEALARQDFDTDRFELIVVDGLSTDATCSVVGKFAREHGGVNVRLYSNPGRLSSCARNIGIRQARGSLIAVIDGHVHIPSLSLFRTMERIHRERGTLCLARPAPLDAPGLDSGTGYWIAVARKSWLGHSTKSFIYSDYEGFVDPMSSGFAYNRSVFDKVGYFDESFDAAEDVEFHYRLKQAGIAAYTSPGLLIYSYPRESLRALLRQQVRYGVGRARLIRKHPEAFTLETLIPAGILGFFAAAPAIGIWWHSIAPISLVYGITMAAYWAILLGTGVFEALRRKRFWPGVLVALAIWVTHLGLGWGFVKSLLSRDPTKGERKGKGSCTCQRRRETYRGNDEV